MQTIYILKALKQADYMVQMKIQLGVKKGVKLPKKGVKLLIQRNFHMETCANHIYSYCTQVGGLYGTSEQRMLVQIQLVAYTA